MGTKIEILPVFKSTNTVAFRTQKRYPSIVCLLFCEKNLFYFYNHNRNSRLILCKLPVLGKLLFLFFEIILLCVRQFVQVRKKKLKSRRPLKKKGHMFLSQKSVNKVKKNLYVCMQKKKVLS